jgi:hypothetical protein
MTGHKNGEPGPVHWGDTWCLCLGPTGSQLVSSKCQAEMPTRDGTWPSSLGRHLVLVPRPHWESTGFIQVHSFTFNFLNYLNTPVRPTTMLGQGNVHAQIRSIHITGSWGPWPPPIPVSQLPGCPNFSNSNFGHNGMVRKAPLVQISRRE